MLCSCRMALRACAAAVALRAYAAAEWRCRACGCLMALRLRACAGVQKRWLRHGGRGSVALWVESHEKASSLVNT